MQEFASNSWWFNALVGTDSATLHFLRAPCIFCVVKIFPQRKKMCLHFDNMGGVNFVTTIVKMRAPGMTFFRMPLFVWAVFSAQIIQLFGLPALTAGAIMLLFDLSVGTAFFNPDKGGNPILFQHLFWFYSHPAVYVIILPIFGIFSEIFPVYSRKPLFGYRVVAISSLMIAAVSALVWVHHMYIAK